MNKLHNRIISLVLVCLMMLGTFSFVSAGNLFEDVVDNYWATDAIDYVKTEGIMIGYGGTNRFGPQDNATRAQFVKILVEANDLELITNAESKFSDVSSGWYYDYVITAADDGIIDGYPDGTFRPHDNITRQDAAKIIAISTGIGEVEETSKVFDDQGQIRDAVEGYVNAVVEAGYMSGYGNSNNFGPQQYLQRQELAQIIFNISKVEKEVALSKVITASELNEILNDEDLVIFDLRSEEDFEIGHIPGALNINNKEFEDPDNPIDGEIATPEQLEAVMSSYGLKSTDRVVVYAEASKPQMSPRLVWTLEFYDHTNTHVLDGQYEAWVEAGFDVEEGSQREIKNTEYKIIGTNKEINVDNEYVLGIFEGKPAEGKIREGTVLLDCRPTGQYTGESTGSNLRNGHIPGAVNVPYMNTVDEDGYFLSTEELKDIYEEVGITGEGEVIVYCQRGHRASHSWFVLHHFLGYEDIKVYDGSMMEWANDIKFPMIEWEVQ